jgi:DNA-binding transcriptional MerR regulator
VDQIWTGRGAASENSGRLTAGSAALAGSGSNDLAGSASLAGSAGDDAMMSIGEVLAHLRSDFPDTTISKLRFLETEGLVEPRRTASGYRKYTWGDLARLRYILTAQRDHYLPLRVIREHLAAIDRGENPTGGRPSLMAVEPAAGAEAETPDEVWLTRQEVLDRAGIDSALLQDLERHGLVGPLSGGSYPADALDVVTAAARLIEYGLEARHLRPYRVTADREVGLFNQMVAPMVRQNGPAARARAAETVRELATLTQQLYAALVRAGLRDTLGP